MSRLDDTTDVRIIASGAVSRSGRGPTLLHAILMAGLAVLLVALPWLGLYPYVLAQVLCFALFACAFNMMLGFGGLLSFGHSMFFGFASYAAAYTAKNGLASLPFWLPRVGWFDLPIGLPPFAPELAILTGQPLPRSSAFSPAGLRSAGKASTLP